MNTKSINYAYTCKIGFKPCIMNTYLAVSAAVYTLQLLKYICIKSTDKLCRPLKVRGINQ